MVKQQVSKIGCSGRRSGRLWLNWVKIQMRKKYMQLLAPFSVNRALPDFLIVGAMKSGTSSLFYYLSQHPGIVAPITKEVHFLDSPRNFRRGGNWYRAHFPKRQDMENISASNGYRALSGEATPAMISGVYAVNAASLVPQAKIIMILRDPVERAYSHYQHQRRSLFSETLPFMEALKMEGKRTGRDIELNSSEPHKIGRNLWRYSYLERGKYIDQIERWLCYFPRDQLKILNFGQLREFPDELCGEVCQFLGLPQHRFDTLKQQNVGKYQEPLEASCRTYLEEAYRPYNRRLFDFLGEDWGWPC